MRSGRISISDEQRGKLSTLAMGLANSETGVITEPPEKTEAGWAYGAYFARSLFLDVTQAVGRMPWSFHWSGADMACLSAHKLGGPKGVGALLVRDGLDIEALQKGGGQELGRRSGTENVAGIAGFGRPARRPNAIWKTAFGTKSKNLETF